MKESSTEASRIGLDIGTSRIVAARRAQGQFGFQAELNAFLAIPYSGLTRSVLEKEQVPHTVRGPEMLVYGNESEKFANLFHVETRRPMLDGVLNPNEPDGPVLIREIISRLAGDGAAPGRKVCFSVPGPPLGGPADGKYHEAVVRRVLEDFGCTVTSINEGLAVVYGELEASNYTGIGVSCGGGMCNVCLAYLSVPVISFSVAKAGDYVDRSAAAASGEVATRVRAIKEQSFAFDGEPRDKIHQALTIYYDDMIQTLVNGMCTAFASARNLPKLNRPLPLVLSGGSAMPAGFRDRFERVLRAGDFPIAISEVRLSSDPLHATAKGAAMAALTEAD